jgi:hypothetical protein
MEDFVCNTINENVHNKTNSELVHEVLKLRQAIRKVRNDWVRGDDKCYLDLFELFKVLPEGFNLPENDTYVDIKFCEQYIRSCHHPDVKYVSPQRRIEELEQIITDLGRKDLLVSGARPAMKVTCEPMPEWAQKNIEKSFRERDNEIR